MSTNCLPVPMLRILKLASVRQLHMLSLAILAVALAGCGGKGAVVFAPTPVPEDLTPQRYQHPSGAFSVDLPRHWAVYAQNTISLAAASFTPPTADQATVEITVINLSPLEATGDLGDIINLYQNEIRPNATRYSGQDRQAMGDGSWRLTGIRETAGGLPQQINTFIELSGTFIGIIDVVVPADRTLFSDLEALINTFEIYRDAALQPTTLATLSFVAHSQLAIANVSDWRTPDGVFFVTGEITNHGTETLGSISIRVELQEEDGTPVVGALDAVMGYGVPPGDFAPFSLRFGQGQPLSATQYVLVIGEDWPPQEATLPMLIGGESLDWTDDLSILEDGNLLISGTLTNTGSANIRDPLATITVFDATQNVIGARYEMILEGILPAGESVDFQLTITELGGDPASYFVNIQALPDNEG